MSPPSDLTRLEQTIAELMARIATLQDALDSSSSRPSTTDTDQGEHPDSRRAAQTAPLLPTAVHASADGERLGDIDQITVLRGALKDLGARMAVLTILQEGAESPIPALVQKAGETLPAPSAPTGFAQKSIALRIQALLAEAGNPSSVVKSTPPARP